MKIRIVSGAFLVSSLMILAAPCGAQTPGAFKFWWLRGNARTNPDTDFLGTTDAKPLILKTSANAGGGERMRIAANGNVGIGLTEPGQRLHIGDGNVLIEGGGETALLIKRDFTANGISGESVNPIFQLGRITAAGDGDPELRVLYSDESTAPRAVFEFDRKGIVASVKPDLGSHFEGFIGDDSAPVFRLNSFPSMQLEMGPGGDIETDVAIRREPEGALTLRTGIRERLRVSENGDVGIGTPDPRSALQVVGDYIQFPTTSGGPPPDADCDSATEAGRVIVRTDGPPDIYICRGDGGWVGK